MQRAFIKHLHYASSLQRPTGPRGCGGSQGILLRAVGSYRGIFSKGVTSPILPLRKNSLEAAQEMTCQPT